MTQLPPTDEQRQFAAQRSHHDMAMSQNLFSTVSNYLVLLNGGAAVALLTFYGTIVEKSPELFRYYFLTGETSYVLGSMIAVWAIYCLRKGIMYWSYVWERVAYEADTIENAKTERNYDGINMKGFKVIITSTRWIRMGEASLLISTVLFVLGNMIMAYGMLFFSYKELQ